jgi:S-adenosyl methyltransferase
MMPQIVMSVRLSGNAHMTTLRTAMQLHHARPGCEMEDQRDRQHHVFVRDTTVPSTARMYDYWLGGHDNFAADRGLR